MPGSLTAPRRARWLATAAVPLLLLVGCQASETTARGCAPGDLPTVERGVLTLATGAVTRAPWVVGGTSSTSADPRDGRGYDAAVGFALAERLGVDRDDVRWSAVAFADSLRPGEKPFDIGINQATDTPERRRDSDLVGPYYEVRVAVVAVAERLREVSDLAGLRGRPLAAVVGSPEARVGRERGLQVLEQPDLDRVRGAVSDGLAEGMLADYQTAVELDRDEARLVGGRLVGVLDASTTGESYALVLTAGSGLGDCVRRALQQLRDSGELAALERRWLVEEQGARSLR